MKNGILNGKWLFPISCALLAAIQAPAQQLITFAGGDISGSGIYLSWSAGEIAIPTAADNFYAATQGFQQPAEQAEDGMVDKPDGPTVNTITPNGDGINDVFILENAPGLPDNRLIIVNRWSEIVFQTDGYQNDWQGTAQNGAALPQAAYYYVFYPDKNRPETLRGTIHIWRQ